MSASSTTDVVVVGAGAAGLTAALRLQPLRVTVLTAAPEGTGGSTPLAQGGVAAAVGDGDDPSRHARDTLAVAAELADPSIVAAVTSAAPATVHALHGLGVRFDEDRTGRPLLGLEAGHTRRRILHADGDATGRELVRGLSAAAEASPTIRMLRAHAVDLLTEDRRVTGVVARTADGTLVVHAQHGVVLATGGIGGLYARTTNPPEVWGAGLALAARAGARLADLEFVQFHPTALAVRDGTRVPLLTEALRGEGARLVDEHGRPLLASTHPDGDLAPRDVIARVLWRARLDGRATLLDARAQMTDPAAFPTVRRLCRAHGIDSTREPIPVAPAAHYHMGGVAVDARGRTDLPGLWACGEVAATGMHGANRLASNSLLEAVWSGSTAAGDILASDPSASFGPVDQAAREQAGSAQPQEGVAAAVRAVMWEQVGIERDEDGLRSALAALSALDHEIRPDDPTSRDLVLVARLVASAALARRESRGAHHRRDHPEADPSWRARLHVTLHGNEISTTRVPLDTRIGAVA